MSARRSALVGAALTLAAAAATAARAGAPQPWSLPGPSLAVPSASGDLQPPRLRAQVTAPASGPAAPPKRPGAAPAPGPTAPAATPDEVDDELLEFLGSVGDDEGEWLDFLANTDVDKVAKGGTKVPPRGKGATKE